MDAGGAITKGHAWVPALSAPAQYRDTSVATGTSALYVRRCPAAKYSS
jgi:hypothetical protein